MSKQAEAPKSQFYDKDSSQDQKENLNHFHSLNLQPNTNTSYDRNNSIEMTIKKSNTDFNHNQDARKQSEKIFFFRESDKISQPSQVNEQIQTLNPENQKRLTEFHNMLITNRLAKQNQNRGTFVTSSGLNCNFDIFDDIEIQEDKVLIKRGDQEIGQYGIGPELIKQIDVEAEKKILEVSKPFYERVNPYLAWFLVFYATINAACIPPWIMSIPAEKYLRIAWRFFMQAVMMIPFLLYERRNLPEANQHKYSFSYIFKLENMKKVYLASCSLSIQFTMVLFAQDWNFISHSLVLSALIPFCFSINRIIKKQENHNYESSGQAMVIFGVLCVLADTLMYDPSEAPPSTVNYRNAKVYYRKPWQRLLFGNVTTLIVSYILFRMQNHRDESGKTYPPFLNQALIFAFTSVNMTMSSYFFSGSDLIHDSFWGCLGLFSSEQFSGFLFMSIILGMGNFITSVLINKIFKPIIPATISLFEPIFSTIILQLVGVQIIPGGLSCIGYVFILPGLFVINLGQFLLNEKKNQKQNEENRHEIIEQLQKKIKELQDQQKREETIYQQTDKSAAQLEKNLK
ncbi:transmembrane protein, putative (macronuclear) [Tetrahymena thermophila SB210]|uniref:Transmembrane protein, putative n=1 Tax=Tetrahymena thermophila (strain SB210) TaxID=312017 RepID=Q22B46_TETTS|nr:transmembrane protein, putative [Tetrahymena thermophila SB210]EAR82509.1 transmembrane protein, putative [Tetrahymena thermophila SB210]|eukprot:XP_001030172.1 transmembrane protein, putative [Tetrahymena thermophila SB210]